MSDYTSTALIANVKRRAMVPTSQSTFTNDVFCGMLTDELQSLLVPMIMELDSQYFVTYKDYALNGSQTNYSIPDRTINQKVKSVEIYDPSDKSYWRPVQVPNGQWGFQGLADVTSTFSIQDEQIVFNTAPIETNKYLRVFYYRRPNDIIQVTNAGKITSIDTGTNTIVVDTNPGFTTSTSLDLIMGYGSFRSLADGVNATSVNGYELIFSSLPDALQVNDWVCFAGEAPLAQIPVECQHVLCQAVAIKLLEAMGDQNIIKFSQQKMNELQTHMQSVMKKRVDEQPIRIVNRNGIVDSIRYRNNYFWW